MIRISEEKLKDTLKTTVEDNSSSLDFFASFDESKPELKLDRDEIVESKPELNFDRDEIDESKAEDDSSKKMKKKRIKNIQFVAVAACLILLAFSIVTSGYDFGSLINIGGSSESGGEMAASTADMSDISDGSADMGGGMASESAKAEDESESMYEKSDAPSSDADAKSGGGDAQDSTIYTQETLNGMDSPSAPQEAPPGSAAESGSDTSSGGTDERETRKADSTDVDRKASSADLNNNESENDEKPSPTLTIGLFALAALLTIMLTSASKNEASRIRKIYSVKSIRWTFVILAGASIIAAIVLYAISIL